MAGAELLMRRIACQRVTRDNFFRFGQVIDAKGVTPEFINEGTTERFPDLAAFELGAEAANAVIGIYIANARTFPLRITKLERHRQASQVFMPLGMHCFVVIVAPGLEIPDWEHVSAFLTSPGQGVSLHRGTWHHGLVALNDADRFAVIEGANYRVDTEEHTVPQGMWLDDPDLSS